ncbi:M48 family peptidase, partial [Klebsiella oxytoca]
LVRAPLRLSKARIEAFVAAHDAWIEKHLDLQRRRAAQRPPAPTAEEVEALKEQARRLLPPKVAYWSKKMGV